MSRFERIFRRSGDKKFKNKFRKAMQQASDPDVAKKADRLGIPMCPKCNAPLLTGFGDETGDYCLCVCGAQIPVCFENEIK